MDMNNINNSNIQRPKNVENLEEYIKINDGTEQIKRENQRLSKICQKYEIILKEYQKNYGNELFKNVEELLEKDDSKYNNKFFKKNLLESLSILKEYIKDNLEKDEKIKFLIQEKENLEKENLSLKFSNDKLEKEKEEFEKNYYEIFEQLNKRKEIKNENMKFNKTFNNVIEDKIKQVEDDINSGINPNSNMNMLFQTMKDNQHNNYMNKEFKEKIDYEEIINNLKIENENLKSQIYNLQNKLQKESEEMTALENELNLRQAKIDMLEIDTKALKTEINEYTDAYNSLEIRKNNENDNLINELKEIRVNIDKCKNINKSLEEQNLNYKTENAKLKQENEGLKFDRDNLTKIIEDSNLVVQNATEKEKYVDNIIKSYKKKADEINLEREKLNLKIRMKENQINKLNSDYNNLLKEKINDYETLNNITKNKYEDIIRNKDTEIKELRANILSYKIEKDKYFSDYNLYKNEFDKIEQMFHSENDTYIKKYEEAQNKLNNISNEYMGTINELKIKNENLENEIKMTKNDINSYIMNEKSYEQKIKMLEKNDDELKRENSELKKNYDIYLKQNSMYIKEIERLKAQFKLKLEHEKEGFDNRNIYLENVVEQQKRQLSLVEGKAWDMLKKQQMMTEKYKIELKNTINHYENIINGRIE